MAGNERGKEFDSAEKYLEYCLGLGNKFENPPRISVQLKTAKADGTPINGTDIVASTARQCYAAGTAEITTRQTERDKAIVRSTADAGHHTPRQHQQFTWTMEGVSRAALHDVLHAYPYYNSEQQSQRYVEAKEGSYIVPAGLTPEQRAEYTKAADFANRQYFVLEERLSSELNRRLHLMYPDSGWKNEGTKKRLEDKAKKLGQELARYALPIGQVAVLDHSLSTLQLLRLFRASQTDGFTDEARYVIGRMVKTAAEVDPTLMEEIRKPIRVSHRPEISCDYVKEQQAEFDTRLGDKQTVMAAMPENIGKVLADAVRNVLGRPESIMSDAEALAQLMDPAKNPYLADVWETGIHDPVTQVLRMASPTFYTKLSHTADSQRQRQRGTPGATPPIEASYNGKPDFATPMVIKDSPELKALYDEVMAEEYRNVERCLAAGIPKEQALLMLPNAHNLRIVESGDLFDWLHRMKQRLCYLAQEEIFFISTEQAQLIIGRLPEAAAMLIAPCGVREAAEIRPRCPEGTRWCGQAVFAKQLEEYEAGRLV